MPLGAAVPPSGEAPVRVGAAWRETLLRSGSKEGPKEPDPDTPPHDWVTHVNICSRLRTFSLSTDYEPLDHICGQTIAFVNLLILKGLWRIQIS